LQEKEDITQTHDHAHAQKLSMCAHIHVTFTKSRHHD